MELIVDKAHTGPFTLAGDMYEPSEYPERFARKLQLRHASTASQVTRDDSAGAGDTERPLAMKDPQRRKNARTGQNDLGGLPCFQVLGHQPRRNVARLRDDQHACKTTFVQTRPQDLPSWQARRQSLRALVRPR